jgi:hypothetical protein
MTSSWRFLLCMLVVPSVAGCVDGLATSYVGPITTPADAEVLAVGITDFMASRLPVASTTLALDPLSLEQSGNVLTPALIAALRKRGFATVDAGNTAPPGTHPLRYWITPMSTGNLVRLAIDGGAIEGNRLFVRNRVGRLQPGGPFTIRAAVASP